MKRNSQHRCISATGNCPFTLFVKLDCFTNVVNLDSFGNTFFLKKAVHICESVPRIKRK